MNNKWYSKNCFVKKYSLENDQNQEFGLTSLKKIEKNELVALYSCEEDSQSNIVQGMYYIRHNDNPTCYLDKNQVFTLCDVEPFTELTIKI